MRIRVAMTTAAKPFKVVAVALASKMARVAFAVLRGKAGLSGNFGVSCAGWVRGRDALREDCGLD
jgi:hypothetical protein